MLHLLHQIERMSSLAVVIDTSVRLSTTEPNLDALACIKLWVFRWNHVKQRSICTLHKCANDERPNVTPNLMIHVTSLSFHTFSHSQYGSHGSKNKSDQSIYKDFINLAIGQWTRMWMRKAQKHGGWLSFTLNRAKGLLPTLSYGSSLK